MLKLSALVCILYLGTALGEELGELDAPIDVQVQVECFGAGQSGVHQVAVYVNSHHLTTFRSACNSTSMLLDLDLSRPPTPNKLELLLLHGTSGVQLDSIAVRLWTDDKEVEEDVVEFLSARNQLEKENSRLKNDQRGRVFFMELCAQGAQGTSSLREVVGAVSRTNRETIESFGFDQGVLCREDVLLSDVMLEVQSLLEQREIVVLFNSVFLLVPEFLSALRASLLQDFVGQSCFLNQSECLLSSFVAPTSAIGEFLMFIKTDSPVLNMLDDKRCMFASSLSEIKASTHGSNSFASLSLAVSSAMDSLPPTGECSSDMLVVFDGMRRGNELPPNKPAALDLPQTLSRLCCEHREGCQGVAACSEWSVVDQGTEGKPERTLLPPPELNDGAEEAEAYSSVYLSIIVPIRDREESLQKLADSLALLLLPRVPYTLWAVEQQDSRPFNRGALLNVGFLLAEASGSELFVLQDVDYIPLPSALHLYLEPPLGGPRHLLGRVDSAGGAILVTSDQYRLANGYPNGFEEVGLHMERWHWPQGSFTSFQHFLQLKDCWGSHGNQSTCPPTSAEQLRARIDAQRRNKIRFLAARASAQVYGKVADYVGREVEEEVLQQRRQRFHADGVSSTRFGLAADGFSRCGPACLRVKVKLQGPEWSEIV
ncbi:hypothetical protein GUITHDRAFT_111900 [Guillardia theta CCMP2712]|uniref:Galactosyltransferase N-terminal domain-containing protein n=1 Tax=Guillardia theta (strain CCMP2712) TaxID=905079 RepID=L1J0I7_GUITC|nr:hypothetical protein GUITHDRAFT_111900 [Guillardia theta CCMP2712]EKX42048.1 hypothetical protein GUITHDRAFT_111900 [Guillardia theta CCMP2712]|eukprot:XP_005829028.1 hypothetical protein GUITHDRAFT_111900 [Guillardia theta CCMP2712]